MKAAKAWLVSAIKRSLGDNIQRQFANGRVVAVGFLAWVDVVCSGRDQTRGTAGTGEGTRTIPGSGRYLVNDYSLASRRCQLRRRIQDHV